MFGEGEKMPTAVIQLNFDFVKEWCKRKDIDYGSSIKDLISNDKVIARIQVEVDTYNKNFGNWERIKLFELTEEVWSVDNKLLTPTFKTKRTEIRKKFSHLYDKMYKS